jgi:hypothetical protein
MIPAFERVKTVHALHRAPTVNGKELLDSKINVDRLKFLLLPNKNDTGISNLVLIPEVMPIKAFVILGCRNAVIVGSIPDWGIDIWGFLMCCHMSVEIFVVMLSVIQGM